MVIYEDRAGTLWVGTRGGGLNRLDRATETFTHFTTDLANPASPGNPIEDNPAIAQKAECRGIFLAIPPNVVMSRVCAWS